MEGASASLRSVSPPCGRGQEDGGCHDCHRARNDRFHLGDRPPGPAAVSLVLEKTRLDPPDSVGSSSDLALRWSTESHQWHPSPTLGALPKSSPEAAMRGGADAGLEVGNAPRDNGTGCLWSIPSDTSDRSSVDLYSLVAAPGHDHCLEDKDTYPIAGAQGRRQDQVGNPRGLL